MKDGPLFHPFILVPLEKYTPETMTALRTDYYKNGGMGIGLSLKAYYAGLAMLGFTSSLSVNLMTPEIRNAIANESEKLAVKLINKLD